MVDRDEVGAGASWGNAGYLSPGLAMPLTSPHVLGEGLRGLADRRAPLSIPARWDPSLWGFLLRFAAHCRAGYWRRALQYHLPLLEECLPAFDTLASNRRRRRGRTHRSSPDSRRRARPARWCVS